MKLKADPRNKFKREVGGKGAERKFRVVNFYAELLGARAEDYFLDPSL